MSERPARPRVLIEDWLPIRELGIESRRESAPIPGQFPKLKTLHVWWARRPLAAAAGTILGSLLPAWSEELRQVFDDPRTATETAYRTWVLRLCGVWGDPVAARKVLAQANEAGRRLSGNGYGYSQAYKNSPTSRDLLLLHRILSWTWGGLPRVTDPTAGGGSIPYEAIRYGLPVNANDLNPVAASVLRAGVEVPARGGAGLKPELEKWGEELVQRCRTRLGQFFQLEDGRERVVAYIFARTVICPRNNKPTPLSPNWWLSKEKGDEWAVRVRTERDGAKLALPEFEILRAKEAIASDPDKATVSGGNGISVWDGLPIDGEYIKREAQAGRLGTLLYAVAVRYPAAPGGRTRFVRAFRPPTALDLQGLASAEAEVRRLLPTWLATGVVPSEEIPAGNDKRPQQYGMTRWIDLFSPRQLLVHATFVEEHHRIATELAEALGEGGGSTVAAMLGLMQGKAVNWDSILSSWDGSRSKIRSVFERHDLAFKWTFAEFEGAWELFPWCLEQLLDAYDELVALSRPGLRPYPVGPGTWSDPGDPAALEHPVPGPVTVTRGSAARLGVPSSSQTLVCIDPPYYDNVMYGELSDFFGVWEQHTVGAAWPDLMPGGLADTANEAVANVARFESFGRRKKELAHADYQAKMGAIFAECRRILRPDGVLTVMFTHKRAEAWDTLGTALMEAGFEIAASWPVNTESEQSLHLAKKNGASSTVMLVCRRRGEEPARETVFFEDLTGEIRAAAREAAARFAADGIAGVDLLLATYGPVLSVLSAAWPVYSAEADATGNARLLRPEEALDVAREELVQARRRALVGREVTFDAPTDFWLLAWELFQAEEFPYDEARRLALAIGGQDPEGLARAGLLTKRAGTVVLRPPADRRRQVLGPVRDGHLEGLALVDVLHAVLATAELDGLAAAKALMDRLALTGDARFVALVQGAVNALPRARKADKLIRQEAALLDALVTAYLPTVRLPGEEAAATLFDPD